MIPARHTWFHVRFFRFYADFRIRKNFSSVTVHNDVPEVHEKPLVVIANHFSWWDGFFILWLNHRYFRKLFHVMMLEDQLQGNMILNKTGAFSIKKSSRDMVESLNYARGILERPTQMSPLLLMYPQGEIQSMHTRPLKFEKGLEHITRGLENKINILMVAVLVDYFSDQKPQLHFYLELYPFIKQLDMKAVEDAYNLFFSDSINHHILASSHQPIL
jgi:1-acyl-sn-glycerol-3-phosphate acyltransferase